MYHLWRHSCLKTDVSWLLTFDVIVFNDDYNLVVSLLTSAVPNIVKKGSLIIIKLNILGVLEHKYIKVSFPIFGIAPHICSFVKVDYYYYYLFQVMVIIITCVTSLLLLYMLFLLCLDPLIARRPSAYQEHMDEVVNLVTVLLGLGSLILPYSCSVVLTQCQTSQPVCLC